MKYLDEYRDAEGTLKLAREIARKVTRPWNLMEVCGGQTHAIVRFGLDKLITGNTTPSPVSGSRVCV